VAGEPGRAEDLDRLNLEGARLRVVDGAAAEDRLLLAADVNRLVDVCRVRPGVGDVVRVDGRERAGDDDQDEDEERGERDVVATEPAPGEVPRTAAGDRNLVLLGREEGGGVESEVGCWLGHCLRFAASLRGEGARVGALTVRF
jgi:hypothetical protein